MEEQEPTEPTAINEETRAMEEVINAFFYYGRYGAEKMVSMVEQMRCLIFFKKFEYPTKNFTVKFEFPPNFFQTIWQ